MTLREPLSRPPTSVTSRRRPAVARWQLSVAREELTVCAQPPRPLTMVPRRRAPAVVLKQS